MIPFLHAPTKLPTALATHQAPPVIYPLGRLRFLGWLLLGLWLAGSLIVLLSLDTRRPFDWRMVLTLAVLLGAGAAVRSGWNNAATGQLAWDGEVWRWESMGYQAGIAAHELLVIADFQGLMLLRLENRADAKLWLWVERSALPERWLDLRRAVYSPRKSPTKPLQNVWLQAEPQSAVAASDTMQTVDQAQEKP